LAASREPRSPLTNQPLSVQLYSVRHVLPGDRAGVMRRLADMGYDAVEPYEPTVDPHGLRRLADELGLAVPSVHARGLVDGDADAAFAAAEVLRAELVVVPAGFAAEDFGTREGVERVAAVLNGLAERAASHGLALGYHNHWWELEGRVDGEHALVALAARLDPRAVIELDVYWAALAGADVLELMARLEPRVRALHLKDGPIVRDAPHTALGHGRVPLREILAAAPGALRVVELDECDGDVFDALAQSRTYLAALA
jgi:sugar phosphate isomerase/epimerase